MQSNQYPDVMIVGGKADIANINDVEMISKNGTSNCLKPSDYPTNMRGMVATLVNGNAFVCGGYAFLNDGWASNCNSYDFNTGIWTPNGSMVKERGFASAAMLNDSHWWVTGGAYGNRWKTTELYNVEANTFELFLDLPVATEDHVVLKLDETHFYLCCGEDMHGKAYILDLSTEIWTETPLSQYDHQNGFAGMT